MKAGLLIPLLLAGAAAPSPSMHPELLWKRHAFFELRDTVGRLPPPADFYAGAIACAFNETKLCERILNPLARQSEPPALLARIHHVLMIAALRDGRYATSFQELRALKRIDPNQDEPIVEALGRVPDQIASGVGGAREAVQMRHDKVPVTINGGKAAFFFDTGANLSVIGFSEARRLGMQVEGIAPSAASTDINGNQVEFRIAVAKDFRIAGVTLNNVAFLVSADDQQPFASMAAGERGLIGLSVLRALGSVTWDKGGDFEVDNSPARPDPSRSNLCFDDFDLVVRARFGGQDLPFVLDSGAEVSDLWPNFGKVAADLVARTGHPSSYKTEGMGGAKTFDAIAMPLVSLGLGGQRVVLKPANLLQIPQRDASRYYYGNLGIDLLGQAGRVTLDFRRMTLTLASSRRRRRSSIDW